jgi:hypothetical protein
VFKTKLYESLLAERAKPFPKIRPDGEGTVAVALRQSRHRESEALHEYSRVLSMYARLVTDGKVPQEDPW